MRTALLLMMLATPTLVAAQSVTAPAAGDRWARWVGCWTPEGGETPPRARPTKADAEHDVRVCVTRDARTGGVIVDTHVGARVALSQPIVADGTRRDLQESDCQGWQQDEWSASGQGLYSRAELTCGKASRRVVSGLAWNTGETWIDIQQIDAEGRRNLRIRRYVRLDADEDAAAPGVRAARSVPLPLAMSLPDVRDASGKLPPPVVEAALIETDSAFRLDGKQMLALSRAGVPPSILDLMVALSHPKYFVVERRAPSRITASAGSLGGGEWPIYGGYGWFDVFALADEPYLWSAYHSPFGYRYWGSYDPYFFPSAGFITIGAPGVGTVGPPPAHGRVVAGEGYTRVIPRESGGLAGMFGGGGGGADGASGTSGSSGGAASPMGYSGGGAADGGRTAQPRNP